MSGVFLKAGAATLKFVLSLAGRALRNKQADSLIRFTKSTRVEPITMIDQRVAHLPYIGDVMQSLSSIFAGYYLQAVAIAVNVGNVQVIKLLDALNPSRDAGAAAASKLAEKINKVNTESLLSLESYRFGLPTPGQTVSVERKKSAMDRVVDATVKAPAGWRKQEFAKASAAELDQAAKDKLKDHPMSAGKGLKAGFGKNTVQAASENVDLSVGKLLEVTIDNGEGSATFPVTVRLIAATVASSVLVHILGDGSRDTTIKERWHLYKAGQLEFWRDLVLCQDMIDAHKKAMLKDKSGVYNEVLARRSGNAAASQLTGQPSVGTASNLIVLSKDSAKELEFEIGGKLSNIRTREKVFKSTYIMIMVVVDPDWEQVTIYHRGIALPTQLSVKELKAANKGSGPDVAEILKAYQLGSNPSI